jgi:hypothetical protein
MNDLKKQLEALDDAYGRAEPSPALRRKLFERVGLEKPLGSRRRPLPWVVTAGALAAAVVVAMVVWPPQSPGALEAGQTLTLREGGLKLRAEKPTRLAAAPEGVRVVAGEVRVEVAKVSPDQVVKVWVSHGAIEVHGTRFTVVQDEASGQVTLHEGRITFRSVDGRLAPVLPGATLRWPLPEPPATAEAAPAPAPREVRRAEPSDARKVLERVASLRARKAYDEAANELRGALSTSLKPESRELLSYELGSILTHHLREAPKACAHWKAHLSRFPKGPRAADAKAARDSLKCR